MERVFPDVWAGSAGADPLLRVLPLWDPVQRAPAGDPVLQQFSHLPRYAHPPRLVCLPAYVPLGLGQVNLPEVVALWHSANLTAPHTTVLSPAWGPGTQMSWAW